MAGTLLQAQSIRHLQSHCRLLKGSKEWNEERLDFKGQIYMNIGSSFFLGKVTALGVLYVLLCLVC